MIRYRRADPGDAEAIARVHLQSWRETYTGLLPDELIHAKTAAERATAWRNSLLAAATNVGAQHHALLAYREQKLVAFGSFGPQRNHEIAASGFAGEFSAKYVLQCAQRCGIGRTLMALMAAELLLDGFRSATVIVLRDNGPARQFYEHIGGAVLTERLENRGSITLPEVVYAWSELTGMFAPIDP